MRETRSELKKLHFDRFDLTDMALLGARIRECAEGMAGIESAAQAVVKFIDSVARMPDSFEPGLALTRLYLTQRFSKLDAEQREFASRLAGVELSDNTPCLVLVGSYGCKPEWCDPRKSAGHIAIPMLSLKSVEGLPMIWRLFQQLGVNVDALLKNELRREPRARRLGLDVFHIERALGSDWVPAQDFVQKHGVESCLAIGSVLPDGEVVTLLMFSKVRISGEVADQFRPLSLSIELALLPYLGLSQLAELEATVFSLRRLLQVKDSIVADRVAKLEEARVQAETQTKLREELLRNVRHELRTPMNGVLGMLEMLQQSDTIGDDDRRLASIALGSASGFLHMVENMIDYSDLATRRRQARLHSFDLSLLLEGLLEPMRSQGPALSWELRIAKECPRQIHGDEEALAGVLKQLLENAMKFTHSGRVEVAARMGTGGTALMLDVSDTGVGIAPDRKAFLFEPFRQADGSTRRRYGGTGLGLAIATELVDQMHGQIEVESELGRGSRFRVTVPLLS